MQCQQCVTVLHNASADVWPSRACGLNTHIQRLPVATDRSRDAHRRFTGSSSQRDSSPPPPGPRGPSSPPLHSLSPGSGVLKRSSMFRTQIAAFFSGFASVVSQVWKRKRQRRTLLDLRKCDSHPGLLPEQVHYPAEMLRGLQPI